MIFEPGPSQGTSPLRAFTLISGWQGEDGKFAPTGLIITDPLRVIQGSWALVWSLVGEMLRVRVHHVEGQAAAHEHEAISTRKSGEGIAYIDNQGTFYLTIEALGQWVVKAVLVEEVGDFS